jgi:riboflavin kinase / FMN adenylyltransferase
MRTIVGLENIQRSLKNPALTIGNFDGVHLGHQVLYQRVKEWAGRLDGESVVMTFHPHPMRVLVPGNDLAFITSHERKMELIAACGIDTTIVIPFERDFAQISAKDFVEKILVGQVGVKALVVGHDYRFGRKREGDIDYLRKLGQEFQFAVDIVPAIEIDGMLVSSTQIRTLVKGGQLQEASKLLGRPYEVTGTVIRGRDRGGRLLGFPTANVKVSDKACPKNGVYAVQVLVKGKLYRGAANLGFNPTFANTEFSVEVFIMDFCEDIYNERITVRFVERLRDEKRFSGIEELKAQIHRDVDNARAILTAWETQSTRLGHVGPVT